MGKNKLTLVTLFGVPVRVDVSWLLIFALVTYNLSVGYFPEAFPDWQRWLAWLMGIAASLSLFGSVLLHEMGHALVAKRIGVPVHDVTLYLFGGAAQITDEPKSPRDEALLGLAGPAVSLALSGVFHLLYLTSRGASPGLGAYGQMLARMNLSLGLFNLIPGFPLDGGRVLRAALWAWRGDVHVATRWAARVGQVVASIMIFVGAMWAFSGNLESGLWIAFIGLFLQSAARNSYAQLSLRKILEGHVVGELMSRECSYLPPQLTLDVLVNQYLLTGTRRCYVVGRPEEAQGLLTVHNVRQVPERDWRTTRVGEVSTPLADVISVRPDTPLWDVLQRMTTQGVNQLPVLDQDGTVSGMISRDQLITFLTERAELAV